MTVRADLRQFIADHAGLMAITAFLLGAVPVYLQRADRYLTAALVALLAFMLSVLIIRYVMLRCVCWTLEEETLCRTKGVFSKQTDYIELYRITDYTESRTLLQRIMGVKTVTIFSTDRSDSVSDILGVPAGMNLVGMLRDAVERTKRERNIYEIANY